MSPTCSRSSLSATPASPGSRWCSGAMALNRWVTHRAPASTAAVACSAVAGVCPSDTITPRSTSAAITSSAPGRSGAMVTSATPASRGPPLDGVERRLAAAAPRGGRRASARDRNGPSRCSPSGHGAAPPVRRPGGERGERPVDHTVGRGDDRRQPRRHPEPRQQRTELPQPLRLRRPGRCPSPRCTAGRCTRAPRGTRRARATSARRAARRRRPSTHAEVGRPPLAVEEHRAPRRIRSPTGSVWRVPRLVTPRS